MSLTRKHFEQIANIIKEENKFNEDMRHLIGDESTRLRRNSIENIAESLADMCQDNNSLFNRQRFMQACGF